MSWAGDEKSKKGIYELRGIPINASRIEADIAAVGTFGGNGDGGFVFINREKVRDELPAFGRVDGEHLRHGGLMMCGEDIVEEFFERSGIAGMEIRRADLQAEQRRRIVSTTGVGISLRRGRHVRPNFQYTDIRGRRSERAYGTQNALNLLGSGRRAEPHTSIGHEVRRRCIDGEQSRRETIQCGVPRDIAQRRRSHVRGRRIRNIARRIESLRDGPLGSAMTSNAVCRSIAREKRASRIHVGLHQIRRSSRRTDPLDVFGDFLPIIEHAVRMHARAHRIGCVRGGTLEALLRNHLSGKIDTRIVHVHDGAFAARCAARVQFEVRDLIENRGPIEDALIRRILRGKRSVQARRLSRPASEIPRHVVGQAIDMTSRARTPGFAIE